MSNIGWIGTGVMGGPMAAHLIGAGYRLTIFTRTESKARELIDAGGKGTQALYLALQHMNVMD